MNPLLLAVASVLLGALASFQGQEPAPAPAPEPAPVQGDASPSWKLDLKFDAPRAAIVVGPGHATRVFWYSTFTVANKTGAARAIAPFVSITTDTKKTYPVVFDPRALAVARFVTGEELIDIFELGNTIDDGATKRCVAIFGDFDSFANHFDLRAMGFASGLARKGGEWSQRQLEYHASYTRPGNEFQKLHYLIALKGDGWVTVEQKKIRG